MPEEIFSKSEKPKPRSLGLVSKYSFDTLFFNELIYPCEKNHE